MSECDKKSFIQLHDVMSIYSIVSGVGNLNRMMYQTGVA